MRYRFDDYTYTDIDELFEDIIDGSYHEDDDYFEEWVNDNYGGLEIEGHTFTAYQILYDSNEDYVIDRIKEIYCEEADNNDKADARYDLEHANIGDEVWIQGQKVCVIGDEDEEEEGDEAFDEVARKSLMEEALNNARESIKKLHLKQLETENADKKNEDEMMSLFQVVG